MATTTHFGNIQSVIIEQLLKAESQILVAMAWLTDSRIYDVLCLKAQNLVDVQIIIVNDETNQMSGIDYEEIVKCGGKLFWQQSTPHCLMHHKFCVIDGNIVITGSYNWTNKAASNIENIIVLENEDKVARDYINEFASIIPKFEEASFFDKDYKPAEYFDTPAKRSKWFNALPEKVQKIFLYYGIQLNHTYDSEGYAIENENLDDNIAAIFRIKEIILCEDVTLEHFRHLSNLEDLTVSSSHRIDQSNRISDLSPLSNLIKLKYLSLREQNIRDLRPLSKLKRLRELDLSHNNIRSLDGLENMINLKELWINHNKIENNSAISKFSNLKVYEKGGF